MDVYKVHLVDGKYSSVDGIIDTMDFGNHGANFEHSYFENPGLATTAIESGKRPDAIITELLFSGYPGFMTAGIDFYKKIKKNNFADKVIIHTLRRLDEPIMNTNRHGFKTLEEFADYVKENGDVYKFTFDTDAAEIVNILKSWM